MAYLEFKGNISRLTFIQESFQRLLYILAILLFYSFLIAFWGIFNKDAWDVFISGELLGLKYPLFEGWLIIWVILDIIPLQIARARNIGIDPFWVISYLITYISLDLGNVFDNEPIKFIFILIFLSFEVSLFIFQGMGNQEEE